MNAAWAPEVIALSIKADRRVESCCAGMMLEAEADCVAKLSSALRPREGPEPTKRSAPARMHTQCSAR
jgi:hypothetical protein